MSAENNKRAQLIGDLVAELEPTPNPGRTLSKSFGWLTIAILGAIGLMLVRGPFRPGFFDQLIAHPHFAVESVLGTVAIIFVSLAASNGFPAAVELEVTVTNNSPAGGVAITPVWVGFHNGSFDSYDGGATTAGQLEALA